MSNPVSRRSGHPRTRRVALLATTFVAAVITAVSLNAAGLSTLAFADSVHAVASTGTSATRSFAPTQSDPKLIAEAASERAFLAAEAQSFADREAAVNAAAAAAANAAAANAARLAAAAAAASRTVNVWTAGFQTEINECRGGVDITAHYGTPTIAEHWSCGGSAFPTAAGTIVTVTGMDAGTYRVTGVVAILNAYTAHTNQIPHGYSLLFQTCRNGDSHYTQFVGLQKIG
jgi:hypothetical protein